MIKISQDGEVMRIDSSRAFIGQGYYWTTLYLVDGLLIDTGCAHTAGELSSFLDGMKITGIANTHSHEDHIGANGLIQGQRPGLPIQAHPLALPVLENPRQEQPQQLYRRVFWGWPTSSRGRSVLDGEYIETQNFRLQVIFTPGHSLDHICLYEPERGWLFTGDLFNGGRDRGLRVECDIWGVIQSLKRIAKLPLNRLYPGCARIRENPHEALIQKIEYLETKGEQVLALRRKGMDRRLIAQAAFGRPLLIEFMTFGHFSRLGLVDSYLRIDPSS